MHHIDIVWGTLQMQTDALMAGLAAAVERHEEIIRTALHGEVNGDIIAQHDGAYIDLSTVRSMVTSSRNTMGRTLSVWGATATTPSVSLPGASMGPLTLSA